jgi:hypothetical protein
MAGTESADDDQPEGNRPPASHGDAAAGPAPREASYTVSLSLRRTERVFEWASRLGLGC